MTTSRRRTPWILIGLAPLALVIGCSRQFTRTIDYELARDDSEVREESGMKITGYVLIDGTEEDFDGWVRLAGEDSLIFWSRETVDDAVPGGDESIVVVAGPVLSRASVSEFKLSESKTGATVALVIGGMFLFIVAIAAIDVAANGIGPGS